MKRSILYVYTSMPGKYVLVRGPLARTFLRDNRLPAVSAPIERGNLLRRERLADLLAMAAEQGFSVRVRAGDAP